MAAALTLLISTMVVHTIGDVRGVSIAVDFLKYLDQTLGILGQLVKVADWQLVQVEKWRGLVLLTRQSSPLWLLIS